MSVSQETRIEYGRIVWSPPQRKVANLQIPSSFTLFAWWKRCALCLVADAASGKKLCVDCQHRLRRQRLARQITPRTGTDAEAGIRVMSLYRYRAPLRDLLLRAKVKNDHRALDLLAELVTTHPEARAAATWADTLIVCPSSLWGRLRGRLDVAHHIAAKLSGATLRPLQSAPPPLYWRLRKRAQHKQQNTAAAHSTSLIWRGALRRWRERLLQGPHVGREIGGQMGRRRLLIVDDVTTTGRTLGEVIDCLPSEVEVRVLTLAAGGTGGPGVAFGLPPPGGV